MKNRLKGKWVLITGASAGIGRASAMLFAESQCNLLLTARREKRLEELKEELLAKYEINIHCGVFDVRDREACKSFLDKLNEPIDILINNAGLAKGKEAVYEADFSNWDAMIDTNIKGLLTMTRYVAAAMKERNSGHIINVGSISGHESYPGGSVYCGTKHAVRAITEGTKKDLHGTNIRVSMVSPGLVNTEFSEVRFDGDKEKADDVYEGLHPLVAKDIAEIILFTANRPAHVNIMDTIVLPQAQSSSTMVARNEN